MTLSIERAAAPSHVRLPLCGVRRGGDGHGAVQEGGQAGGRASHAAATVAPRPRRAAALRFVCRAPNPRHDLGIILTWYDYG